MNRIIIIALLTGIASQGLTQPVLSNQFTRDELKEVLIPRDQWKPAPGIEDRISWGNLPEEVKQLYLSSAEELLDYKWPSISASTTMLFVRTGDRDEYQGLSFPKRSNLGILVMAEVIENEGRFMDQIVDGIWSICEESYWGVPAHLQLTPAGDGLPDVTEPWVDLFAAETVNYLAWADYFLGKKLDEFSPQLRKRIKYEADRRIFNAILNTPHAWREYTFNWNPWICSNWLNSVLLLENDQDTRANHVSLVLDALDNFLGPYPADGGCDEGPGYWNAAGSSLFECLEVMNLATNGQYQVYEEPKIRNIGSYIYKVQISEDYFINFADANPSMTPGGYWIYRFGERINDPMMKAFGASFLDWNEWINGSFQMTRRVLLMSDNQIPLVEEMSLPLPGDVWFPEIQWMLSRDMEGSEKGLCLAAKGGHNEEAHNHNDVGNFIIYHDGNPVLIDVGRGTYTARFFSSDRYSLWMTNAAHHNVPMINGEAQPNGREYQASDVEYSSKGRSSSLKMELKNAYGHGSGVTNLKRTLTHIKGKEVRLDESIGFERAGDVSEILMTTYKPDILKPGEVVLHLANEGDQEALFRIRYDPLMLEPSFKKMSLDEPEDEAIIRYWGEDVYRIELKSRHPVSSDHIEIRFTVTN